MSFLDRLRSWRAPVRETRHHLSAEIRRWGFSVGEYSYGRPKIRFPETGAQLTIGRYCSIADRVEIFLGGNHRTDWVTTYPFDNLPGLWPRATGPERSHVTRGGVTIGNDVWIGSGAVVLSGVHDRRRRGDRRAGGGGAGRAGLRGRRRQPGAGAVACASTMRRSRRSSRAHGGSCRAMRSSA